MRQLANISGLGKSPIEILPAEKFPRQNQICAFPPLIVFKYMSLPVVLDSRVTINVETQTAPDTKDEEKNTSTGKRRNSI